jgi:Sulfotransferase domain
VSGERVSDRVNIPNFFIIGAPKCGTDSLYAWLSAHPNIYMSPWKEPHYFNDDHRTRGVCRERDYLKLYRERVPSQTAVGEASVWYLYSGTAVRNILAYNRDARFIVCLRNPIEMAVSLHNQLVVSGYETIRDFEEAWEAQKDRAKGRRIPLLCRESALLQYGAACSLGAQLQRLFQVVPRETVATVLLDDVARDARSEYRRVLEFLGVPDDGRSTFPVLNSAIQRRSYALLGTVQALGAVKRALRIPARLGILERIDQANVKAKPQQRVSTSVASALRGHFASDVALLSELLSRDLTHWLRPS